MVRVTGTDKHAQTNTCKTKHFFNSIQKSLRFEYVISSSVKHLIEAFVFPRFKCWKLTNDYVFFVSKAENIEIFAYALSEVFIGQTNGSFFDCFFAVTTTAGILKQ